MVVVVEVNVGRLTLPIFYLNEYHSFDISYVVTCIHVECFFYIQSSCVILSSVRSTNVVDYEYCIRQSPYK